MVEEITDIPRFYTALAEWLGCMTYILILKKRYRTSNLAALSVLFLALLGVWHQISGRLPLPLWIPGMAAAVALMYLFLHLCCDSSFMGTAFCCARAFIAAEFAASLEWQIYTYYNIEHSLQEKWSPAVMVIIYMTFFPLYYVLERRHMNGDERMEVSDRDFASSVIVAVTAFAMSNISFLEINTLFSSISPKDVFYIRTLVDLAGLLVLYEQQDKRNEIELKKNLDAMQKVLDHQYEQYQISKDSIEMINRKYHDLKHQIHIIRTAESPEKKTEYLDQMEKEIQVYEAQNKTGNQVLDTILTGKSLYCVNHDISLTCVADGKLLDFLDVMDICTIFGNALDNAIESVEKLCDTGKRLIRLAVHEQNQFAVIRIENYVESHEKSYSGLPPTTKKDRENHGYGLKSIRMTAEKYGGVMTINHENNWFILRILIPMPAAADGR